MIVLRAEDVLIDEVSGVKAKVVDCRFLGDKYLLLSKLENNKKVVHFSRLAFAPADQVLLNFLMSNAICF